MKRYQMIVSHEVVIYGENEVDARQNLKRNMADRTNVQIIVATEIPMPNDEKIKSFEDYRKAKIHVSR